MAIAENNLSIWEQEELQAKRERAKQAEDRRRQVIIERFGSELGNSFITYAYGREDYSENWQRERAEDRQSFAEAVVNALESSRHEDRVNAVTAVLKAVEAHIEPIARQAADTDSRTAIIG